MKIDPKLQADYEVAKAKNADPYGAAVYQYAERWAELMEKKMAAGECEKLADIAEATSHEADTEGITGFMYGCAVSILTHFWEHGEALRHWHNLKTQLHHEGETANEMPGRVLNPTIISVGE